MKRLSWLVGSMLCLLLSCTQSEETPDDPVSEECMTVAKSFKNNVNPLISSTCTDSACHGSGSKNGPGSLLTYSSIFAARVDIRSAVSRLSIPKNSFLSTAQLNIILCWIDSGAPNN